MANKRQKTTKNRQKCPKIGKIVKKSSKPRISPIAQIIGRQGGNNSDFTMNKNLMLL